VDPQDTPEAGLTALLNSDDAAPERMGAAFEHVYDELRRLAQHHLGRERSGHTLSATALVNEAFMKLAGQDRARWANRAQFFSVASTAMRRILVNYARDRSRHKRGGDAERIDLDSPAAEAGLIGEDRCDEVLLVDDLLQRLEAIDPRAARVAECRYFAGYTSPETAEALGVSEATVKRSWRLARAWMAREVDAGAQAVGARTGPAAD